MRARSPRASVRPRAVLASGAWAAAPLDCALHKSLAQQAVVAEPPLTWLSWPWEGVHQSTQSFSTRFPDRGSSGDDGRGYAGRPPLCATPAPSAATAPQVPAPASIATMTQLSPASFPPASPGMVPQPLGHLNRAPGCRDPFLGPGITHSWSWSCRSASWPRSPAASYSRWHWSIRDSEEPGLQGESVRGPHQPRGGPSGGPDQHGEAPQGRRDARAHSSERPLLDRATRALGLSPLRSPGACQGSCLTHNLGRWEGHPCPLGP